MKEEFGSLFRLRGHSRKTSLWLIHSSTDPVCGHRKESKRREKRERKHQTSALFHAPAVEKETAKSGWCVLLHLCVVPASSVTACSRDGTPWERGADSLTCRCLRDRRAPPIWWSHGVEKKKEVCVCLFGREWRVVRGEMIMRGGGGRLLGAVEAAARGKLLGRSSKCAKCAHKGIKVERWRKAHYLSFLAKNSRY